MGTLLSLRIAPSRVALLLAALLPALPAAAQTPQLPRAASGAPGTIPVATEFDALHFRSIGPAVMSGRIADLAVYHPDPSLFYVGTAHGGLWKTSNMGTTWEALFQDEGLISIGDVAVSQRNPELVWVGAGESNNRQSTSWGGGVYRSSDGGKSFQHMGLQESRHIQNIVLHPDDDDVVLVAATGPLFGPGGDRGIYRTTDGGATWDHVLQVDEDTGANELIMAPSDSRVLFASTYQRRRHACCMNGGGPGSGIWKSVDGGATWTRLEGNGLPEGPLGRISLDIYARDAQVVLATIEGPSVQGGGQGGAGAESVTGVYRSMDQGATWEKVSNINPRPMYFSKILIDPTTPDRVYMGGVGLHMSIDGGETFETDAARPIHDDVHAIWVNPANPSHILIGTDGGVAVSHDMSRTWKFMPNLPVGLFYHVGFDMERPFNVCGGMQDNYNWCGPSATRHVRGIMNHDWFQVQGGDGFHAIPDLRDPRIVYSESQNGNIQRRNTVTGESKNIRPTALNVVNHQEGESYRWSWDTPLMLSPHDPGVLMAAANRVFRSTDRGDSWTAISPDVTSSANRDTTSTMGVVNTDIRIARNDGVSMWPTIVSLAESPRQAGVFYTGTDDGVVSVTRDNGATWQDITGNLPGFPEGGYVTEVVPSRFQAGTVYVTVDNHLNDDYQPYLWVSDDSGATFRSLRGNLRGENVRTLTEDHRNGDVLYIGTETGIFLSLDRGTTWRRLQSNLPTVRVDEITLHPRDNAMIVATHGRAIFIMDDLEPIQEYAASRSAGAAGTLFTLPEALQWRTLDDRNEEFWGHQWFAGENPPVEALIHFHLNRDAGEVKVVVRDGQRRTVREIAVPEEQRKAGIQTVCWDQRVEPIVPAAAPEGGGGGGGPQAGRAQIPDVPSPQAPAGYLPREICGGSGGGGFGGGAANAGPFVVPGTYQVALVVDGQEMGVRPLTIVMDPEVRLTGQERVRYNQFATALHEAQREGTRTADDLRMLARSVVSAGARIDSTSTVPADVRTRFDALAEAVEGVRVKFGVPAGGVGGGGGGFGGGGATTENALGWLAGLKSSVANNWEVPSQAVVQQSEQARAALTAARAEGEAVLREAREMRELLVPLGIALEVPGGR